MLPRLGRKWWHNMGKIQGEAGRGGRQGKAGRQALVQAHMRRIQSGMGSGTGWYR